MAEDHQDIPVASVEPGDSPRIVYVKTVKDRNIQLVVFSFGLLCFLQVALNISLLQTFCFNRTDQKIQLGLIFCFYDAESGHNGLNLTALTDTTKEQIADVCPSVYYISTSRKSWHESRKDCLERGADLLIINSQEEQKFMIQFKRPFWIGLIYAAREKEWKWIDGTLLNT
ncbi:PREDICTED: C-type lectin domain family 4 member A-like, partial [Cyprinodon variegatus]